jgi:hypothetical protein
VNAHKLNLVLYPVHVVPALFLWSSQSKTANQKPKIPLTSAV